MSDPEPRIDPRFEEFRRTPTRERRNALAEDHLTLARAFARRYQHRGVALDDLEQVARIGLLNAIDRFDPEVGVRFSTFAGRTIDGELKRYFRDRAWSVRVPRRSQELGLALRRAVDELSQSLGRAPTTAELAERVGAEPDEVLAALEAGSAYRAGSLDVDHDDAPLVERLGDDQTELGELEDRDMAGRLLAELPERERRIVELRFFEELSQREIAERVGVSQMHVSRLLRQSLTTMREHAAATDRDG